MSAGGTSMRLMALIRKEVRQMLRDRANLVVGLLLPLALILLFGYGLSFDVTGVRLAIVLEDGTAQTRELVAGLDGSPYFATQRAATMHEAEQLVRDARADGILRIPASFSRDRAAGKAVLQLLLNGADSNTAASIEAYVGGALATAAQHQLDQAGNKPAGLGAVTVVQRMWFNESGNSRWYLVPGLLVLVMTLIGAFLTSLLVAREWERGTLEALFATPVRPLEIVLSKLAPYLVVGLIDMLMCILAARFLFQVPIRGSLGVIVVAATLYLVVSLALGLAISAATRNQFAASQLALLTSFMPAMMLSGFVFDLRNVPLVIQWVSAVLPATHFMSLIKTLFLAGTVWPEIIRGCSVLALYALVLVVVNRRLLRKRLDK